MGEKKIKELKNELRKYKRRLKQMQVDWAETKEGSCYGNEYLEIQIKAYDRMIASVEEELEKEKARK